MWNDGMEILTNFYGANFNPTPKQERDRAKKVAMVIELMGDTYCLTKPVKKLNAKRRTKNRIS